VILNALNQVLEPDRPKGDPYFFIEREQDRYRLNPLARIIIDADLFTSEINNGTKHALHRAVKLYKGRYFDDNYVQEFFPIDEQYYHQQFLLAAEKITNLFIDEGKFEQALEITHKILCEDELYEPAYRLQMTIFSKMGKTALLEETFKRCQNTFLEQLDMPLSEITIQHYKSLLANASKNFA
jgi:DNA-binding SARP family transcriptional activator